MEHIVIVLQVVFLKFVIRQIEITATGCVYDMEIGNTVVGGYNLFEESLLIAAADTGKVKSRQ